MSSIREWMNNKTILITGAAGFLGKVLVEKLLRSCPGVKRLYLIIRQKHGKSPQERWDEITKDPLFEKLLAQSPDIMERKVTVLNGDMSLISLGLSKETIQELQNTVNIIFHSAATVRFNDPLQKAFLSNTRGTLEMCKLATKMINLEVFVHVSTTFCNYNLHETHYTEKVYEPCQDWRTVLKLIEKENPVVINTLSSIIIEDHPNTYTFSKSLSEKIIEEFSCKFPAVIARPPLVLATYDDPISGWTDNFYGLFGISAGVVKGVLRVMKASGDCTLEYISVDTAANALLIGGCEKANSENKALLIYNCSYGGDCLTTSFENLIRTEIDLNFKESAVDNDIWYPFLLFAENNFYFHLLFYFLQVLPAVVIDLVLLLMKKKTRLMKLTIKIYIALQATSAFTLRGVTFDSTNYNALWDKLAGDESEIFKVKPPPELTWRDFISIIHKGMKQYLLKEKSEDNECYRRKLMRLYYLHNFVKGVLITAAVVLSYKLINATLHKYIL